MRAARDAVHLRADRLQHRAEGLVGLRRAAGHDRGAVQRALLAARDAHADEVQVLLAERGLAAAGVLEVRVAAVDDHVAGFEQRGELVDHGVGGRARVDHDDQASWPLQRCDELLGGLGRGEGALVAELRDHVRDAGDGSVVQGHGVPVAGEVAGQVAAHHAETGDAYLRRCLRHVLRISCSVLRFRSRGWVTITMPLQAAVNPAAATGADDAGQDVRVMAPDQPTGRDTVMPLRRCRSGLCPGHAGR